MPLAWGIFFMYKVHVYFDELDTMKKPAHPDVFLKCH